MRTFLDTPRPLIPAALLILAALGALAVPACTGTRAAYREAQGLDEYAYVLTEQYASLVNQAADLAAQPTTPPAAVDAMRRADAVLHLLVVGDPAASPAVPGLAQLVANYQQIRNAQTEIDLQAAIDKTVVELANLIRAIKAGRNGS